MHKEVKKFFGKCFVATALFVAAVGAGLILHTEIRIACVLHKLEEAESVHYINTLFKTNEITVLKEVYHTNEVYNYFQSNSIIWYTPTPIIQSN